ncbi:MAG: hypothetical protein ACN6OI_18135 [Flavobacterium sp.]|uniref:hypothetical protein n=1 Tax=Flavobacterium sp. TaxID=239 RepID=UPI003D14E4F1
MSLKNISTKDYTTFRYKPSINELGVYFHYGIFYNVKKQNFEISKDPLQRSKLYEINNLDISEDFSQMTFDAQIGSKVNQFLVCTTFEFQVFINEFIQNLKQNGFSISRDDFDDIWIIFDKETVQHIIIYKNNNGKLVDSLMIVNNDVLSIIKHDRSIKEIPITKIEIKDNTIHCYSANEIFIYKLDSQAVVINVLKKIFDSIQYIR